MNTLYKSATAVDYRTIRNRLVESNSWKGLWLQYYRMKRVWFYYVVIFCLNILILNIIFSQIEHLIKFLIVSNLEFSDFNSIFELMAAFNLAIYSLEKYQSNSTGEVIDNQSRKLRLEKMKVFKAALSSTSILFQNRRKVRNVLARENIVANRIMERFIWTNNKRFILRNGTYSIFVFLGLYCIIILFISGLMTQETSAVYIKEIIVEFVVFFLVILFAIEGLFFLLGGSYFKFTRTFTFFVLMIFVCFYFAMHANININNNSLNTIKMYLSKFSGVPSINIDLQQFVFNSIIILSIFVNVIPYLQIFKYFITLPLFMYCLLIQYFGLFKLEYNMIKSLISILEYIYEKQNKVLKYIAKKPKKKK